eukprot:CAMPEP_0172525800 /NCGR_PEP_ID=MMETSP1067-20121228/821_1 /TAXON_ID=265564 ORGANISM="Thalassiosira punctigera, Strain Tpunct2005C2" /NCGR_SAMPLE_ID=MMETSP1067 /ASSEMBLY_ACC=CAM_ASM_000444 /LENGTH=104 /DNA_ID=CAMNT_0013309155 /DNA_START=51 /DNA_END=361 /DNA_ORIENTATION=-
MIDIRTVCDAAEEVVPANLWTLATYKELLFLDSHTTGRQHELRIARHAERVEKMNVNSAWKSRTDDTREVTRLMTSANPNQGPFGPIPPSPMQRRRLSCSPAFS